MVYSKRVDSSPWGPGFQQNRLRGVCQQTTHLVATMLPLSGLTWMLFSTLTLKVPNDFVLAILCKVVERQYHDQLAQTSMANL